jgi:hypothetical protein
MLRVYGCILKFLDVILLIYSHKETVQQRVQPRCPAVGEASAWTVAVGARAFNSSRIKCMYDNMLTNLPKGGTFRGWSMLQLLRLKAECEVTQRSESTLFRVGRLVVLAFSISLCLCFYYVLRLSLLICPWKGARQDLLKRREVR